MPPRQPPPIPRRTELSASPRLKLLRILAIRKAEPHGAPKVRMERSVGGRLIRLPGHTSWVAVPLGARPVACGA
jgi:hypothetical protein